MSGFETHAFCTACGGHRQRMPFGERDSFWLHDRPCQHCGSHRYFFKTAKYARVGRWPWQWGWVTKKGNPVRPKPDRLTKRGNW